MPIREINLGPLTVRTYGLIIAAAILLGWLIAKKRAHLHKIPPKIFDSYTLFIPLALGLIGGRLYHVVDKWQYYLENPQLIVRVDLGGLGILGGLGGIVLGFVIVSKIEKVSSLRLLDLVSPSLILGQAIGRIGNYVNREGYGPPTNLPWGVEINGIHVHPTFFYEAIIDTIFFVVLLKVSNKLKTPGQLFGLYLILYGLGRFAIEFWRIDTATIGPFKTAHLLSVVTLAIGFYFLRLHRVKG